MALCATLGLRFCMSAWSRPTECSWVIHTDWRGKTKIQLFFFFFFGKSCLPQPHFSFKHCVSCQKICRSLPQTFHDGHPSGGDDGLNLRLCYAPMQFGYVFHLWPEWFFFTTWLKKRTRDLVSPTMPNDCHCPARWNTFNFLQIVSRKAIFREVTIQKDKMSSWE